MNARHRTLAVSAAVALALAGLAGPSVAGGRQTRNTGSTTGHTTTGGTTTTTTTTTGTTTTGTTTTGSGPSGGCGPSGPGGSGGPRGSLISGTITAIDTTAGTITVTPASGTASVIALTTSTNLVGHDTIASSAIAVGDTLDMSGIPVSIQAASIVDDHLPAPSSSSSSTGSSSSSSTAASGDAPMPGSLRVRGVVTALSPPTITVNDSLSITLAVTSSTTFSEVVTLTASQLETGDTVTALVSKSSTGTLTAIQVDVTPPASS